MSPSKPWRAQKATRERARQLRQESTTAEKLIWPHLRNRQLGGGKFRRQHPIGPFILDFYCPDAKVAVELDGQVHERQVDYDSERDRTLQELGIRVLHLPNNEVTHRLSECLTRILEFIRMPK